MVARTFFTVLLAGIAPVALAQSSTAIAPAKTEAFFAQVTAVELSIYHEHSSIFNEVDTLLPSSVYTDYESTVAPFDYASYITAAPSVLAAPWISLLPSSIQTTFEAIATEEALALQSLAKSVLDNTSITGTPPSTQTGAAFSNNVGPTVIIPSSSSMSTSFTPSTLSMMSQASAHSVASKSSGNAAAAATGSVGVLQVAGVALGAVAAAVAAL